MNLEVIIAEFNRLYAEDPAKYNKEIADFKAMGYKILRNDLGEHKVFEPIRKKNDLFSQMGAVGDLFGDIFSR